MLIAVYKSAKKADTYLYVSKRDDFSQVPEPLIESFGKPQFVMLLPLQKREKLGQVDIEKLKNELEDKGFYLQLPPPQENLLKAHREQQKISSEKE